MSTYKERPWLNQWRERVPGESFCAVLEPWKLVVLKVLSSDQKHFLGTSFFGRLCLIAPPGDTGPEFKVWDYCYQSRVLNKVTYFLGNFCFNRSGDLKGLFFSKRLKKTFKNLAQSCRVETGISECQNIWRGTGSLGFPQCQLTN